MAKPSVALRGSGIDGAVASFDIGGKALGAPQGRDCIRTDSPCGGLMIDDGRQGRNNGRRAWVLQGLNPPSMGKEEWGSA